MALRTFRNRRPLLRSRRIKRLRWQGVSNGTGTLTAGSTAFVPLIQNSTIQQMTRATIMRIRGEVFCTQGLSTGSPATVGNLVVWGIRLKNVTETEPLEDPFNHSFADDWMWWGAHWLQTQSTATVADPRDDVTRVARLQVDVRSKRICDPTDELVIVVHNSPATTGGSDVGFVFAARVLMQET